MVSATAFVGGGAARAQVTGPVSYASMATAVSDLNTLGVGSGGATVTITGNETAPAGGYVLGSATLNASLSAANPLVISGDGTVTITAGVGTSTTVDAILKLAGTDNVTVQGFTMTEAATNTTATTQAEWGIALVKRNSTAPFDGCQNVVIQNNIITLNKTNTASVGIYSGNHTATSTTALTTGFVIATDRHFNVQLTGNTVSNVYSGVTLNGSSTAANHDSLLLIGTAGAGNTISNYGGGSATTYGIRSVNHKDLFITGNAVTLPAGTTTTAYGIQASTGLATASIRSNTVQIAGSGTTASIYGISNGGTATTLTIAQNTVQNLTYATATTGDMYGIHVGAVVTTSNLDSNTVSTLTLPGTGTLFGIYNLSTATTLNMRGNTITGLARTGASGPLYALRGATAAITATGNTISNCSASATSGTSLSTVAGYYNIASPTTENISRNTITNLSINGAGTAITHLVYGIYTNSIAAAVKTIDSNEISGLSLGSGQNGTVHGIFQAAGGGTFSRNSIFNLSTGGAGRTSVVGITLSSGTTLTVQNNFISGFSAPTADTVSAVNGVNVVGTAISAANLYHNTIALGEGTPLGSSGTRFGASGVLYNATAPLLMQNNIVSVDGTPAGTGSIAALRRLSGTAGTAPANLVSGTNGNVYYVSPTEDSAHLYAEGTVSPVNKFNLATDPGFSSSCGSYKSFLGSGREAATKEGSGLDLTPGTAPGTFAESSSSIAAGNGVSTPVTTDYFGSARSATFPYAGAYEGPAVAGQDVTAPVISYTPLTNSYCLPSGTLSAAITDASGVSVAPGFVPRMYYKKTTDSNTFAGNTAGDNGYKFVEAANLSSPFVFTPNYSLLQTALVPGDTIQYFIVAQDSAASPNVGINQGSFAAGFCAASVDLSAAAFPLGATPAVRRYVYLTAPTLTLTASTANLCLSGSITLSLGGAAADTAVNYITESAPAGSSTFTPVAGLISPPDTVSLVAADSGVQYRVSLRCGTTVVATSNTVTIGVNNPSVTSTTPGSRCGFGTVSLSAAGTLPVLYWYDASTGGTRLGTGSPFTTPVISGTATFYVSNSSIPTTGSGARPAPVTTTGTYTLTAGLVFDAFQAFTLDTVDVYPTAAGTVAVALQNSAGTTLQTASFAVAAGGGTTAVPLALNFTVPAGTGLRLITTSNPALVREASLGGFPYGVGSVASVTAGFLPPNPNTSYYYFYNWRYTAGCESPRTAVTATVTAAPAVVLTASDDTLCSGQPVTLTASSSNDPAYTYTVTPGGTAGASQTVTPTTGLAAASVVYTITGVDNTAGPSAGCVDTAQITLRVLPAPPPISITPASITMACGGIPVALTVSGNFSARDTLGTSTTGTSTFTTPYRGAQGAHKVQMLYTAAELTALGMTPGSRIDTAGFEITAFTAPDTFVNFSISMKNTSGTSLATAFESGTTLVYSTPALILATAGAQVVSHGLTTPFLWDGVSNLLVETCFNNETTVAGLTATVRTTTITGGARYASTLAVTPAFCSTPPTGTGSTARPNLFVRFSNRSALTPATGLFTDAAGTVPYTGGAADSVIYTRPSSNIMYTAATTLGTCTQRDTANVFVTSMPTALVNATGAADSTFFSQNDDTVTLCNADCELMASVAQSGAAPLASYAGSRVILDDTVMNYLGQHYVQRHYDINPATETGATATLTLYATQAEFDSFNVRTAAIGLPQLPSSPTDADTGNVRVYKYSGTSPTGAPGTYTPGALTVIDPAAVVWNAAMAWWEITFPTSGFSGFFINAEGAVLGASTLNVSARNEGPRNRVRWTVDAPADGTLYEVQRSADGLTFAPLAQAAGTKAVKAYEHVDPTPFAGVNYYRIKTTGLPGGAADYSRVVSAEVRAAEAFSIQAFPNPLRGEDDVLTVRVEGPRVGAASFELTDAAGRVLRSAAISDTAATLDLAGLPAGLYLLRYTDDARTETLKVMKQ